MKVGIIGGLGRMGSWFSGFFRRHGLEVVVSDKNTPLTNKMLVESSDVVVFSVPINITEEVIESLLGSSRPEQLWMDVTSVKSSPVKTMLKSRAEVVGMHPMFAPTLPSARGQNVIVCPERVRKWAGWMENMLAEEGAVIKITSPEKHDKIMAIIQGLTHFSLISLGHAFKQLGLDIRESLEYTSPIYRIRMDMVGRILNQNPRLYADIEILNPETQVAMREYIQSTMKLYMTVKDGDVEGFVSYFKEASDFVGDFRAEATEESRFLIERLVERQKIN